MALGHRRYLWSPQVPALGQWLRLAWARLTVFCELQDPFVRCHWFQKGLSMHRPASDAPGTWMKLHKRHLQPRKQPQTHRWRNWTLRYCRKEFGWSCYSRFLLFGALNWPSPNGKWEAPRRHGHFWRKWHHVTPQKASIQIEFWIHLKP